MIEAVGTKSNKSGQQEVDERRTAPPARVLFLAQLPPPVHGVSTVSAHVLRTLRGAPEFDVEHLWTGSARKIQDVGRKSIGKVIAFAGLMTRLAWRALSLRRYDIAYQTLAPHGDAAWRDGLVIAAGKCVARRSLVHLHTRGLEEILLSTSVRCRLLRWVLRGTELVAVSSGVAETARAWQGFRAVHVLPNFVPDPGRPNIAPGRRLRCGYLGNYDPRKGILRFIDIFAALKSEGFDVEGFAAGGPTRHLGAVDVRRYADERGIGPELAVHGFADEAAKRQLLGATDIFIYPTEHDLAPLVVIEAMAHGAVPVVFDTGALREMVGPSFEPNVVVPDRDPQASCAETVAIVGRHARDPAALASARHASRARYETHFTPGRFEADLLKMFAGRQAATPGETADDHVATTRSPAAAA